MNYEVIITGLFLLLCWAVLAAADAAVAGVAAIFGGARFRTVFLWGLLSLLIPVVATVYGTLAERNWYQVKEVVIGVENTSAWERPSSRPASAQDRKSHL